jgi:hypothetical protein
MWITAFTCLVAVFFLAHFIAFDKMWISAMFTVSLKQKQLFPTVIPHFSTSNPQAVGRLT